MINFSVYKNNPTAAAALISRTSTCYGCPMIKGCEASPYFKNDVSEHERIDKCLKMWNIFFKDNPETLENVDNLAETLWSVTDCDKCEIADECVCDYGVTTDCRLTFCKWLYKDFSICQESRQVEESDSVNHPDHYMLMDGVQVIDVIREVLDRSGLKGCEAFCLGNVIKYVLRADQKNGVEDYKKAAVYLNWLIETIKNK